MKKAYTVRNFVSGDEKGLTDLLELVFGQWPSFDITCSKIEHWRWKYLDNPYKNILVPVVEDGRLIVGSNHGLTTMLKLFDKTRLSSQGTDLATHPDYRKMGIYTATSKFKTEEYKIQGYEITYALTGNKIVFDSNMEWGRKGFPHSINTLIRIKDLELHFKAKGDPNPLKIAGAKILSSINKIQQNTSFKTKESDIEVGFMNEFQESYEDFWEKVRPRYSFIFERSRDYMNWRYCDLRGGEYIKIGAFCENTLFGYIVVRINTKNNYSEGYIVDILSLPDRLDIVSLLVSEANRYFDLEKVNVVYSWVIEGHPYKRVMLSNGYLDSRYEPYFIFQNISLSESDWWELDNIPAEKMHLSYGDSDWI